LRSIYILMMIWTVGMGFMACSSGPPPVDHSVPKVELLRYMGRWYEIASFQPRFQKDCFCTVADYGLMRDGTIAVSNTCRKGSPTGEEDTVIGTARVMKGSRGSRLKVSFQWPFEGDYWIVGLDPDYRWALVGHPHKKYLWVLSRKPVMEKGLYESIKFEAAELGYDVSRLKKTVQTCWK
jgi:apolipoprotein D and lipocalin family protein